MRAVVQCVRSCSVDSEGVQTGTIGRGFCVLLGVTQTDTERDAMWMADKIVSLRVFEDEDGKMNRSLADIGGALLVVSQFTLYANCSKGRRPSFDKAARPEIARPLYERFVEFVRAKGIHVETGVFQTMMLVSIENEGPATFIIDSPAK